MPYLTSSEHYIVVDRSFANASFREFLFRTAGDMLMNMRLQ